MAVPYHTHNFELPAATKQEVVAGISVDKVVVPATLGSAAVENVAAFATAAQGRKADLAVSPDRKIIAGNGLQGGGNLSEDRGLALSETTLTALDNANNAASKYIIISPGSGLTGGGSLTERNIELSLNATSQAAITKAQTAVQPADLGSLAKKSKITIGDITATGTANNTSFLRGDGSWAIVTTSGTSSGDMTKSVYDPTAKNSDAFNMDNMVAGTTNKLFTTTDKTALDNAASKYVIVSPGSGLTGGGSLTERSIELSLNATSQAAITKAQTAVQPADLGSLAKKSKIIIGDITATGTANSNSFLRGDGSWAVVTTSGTSSGDMTRSVYDPNAKNTDAFNMDNMVAGTTNKLFTATDKTALDNAAAKTIIISPGSGLTGGGSLSERNIELSLNATSQAAITKAQTAVQPADLGTLAKKSKVVIGDITATGTAGASSFLRGDGSWAAVPINSADMQKSTYDPAGKNTDAFNMDNMVAGTTNKLFTATDKTALDNAAAKTIIISPGSGLTGGGSLTERNIELSLNTTSQAAITKAQTAVQPADLGTLAKKSKIVISDITASGTAGAGNFLRGDGSWAAVPINSADMQKSIYDPTAKNADAFNMDNMVAGITNKLFTATDKTALDNAAAKTIIISPGSGLTGGGSLTERNIELSLNATSQAAITKAQTAVQPADLGTLAQKSKIVVGDITATGTANNSSFLRGDGSWATVTASGSGSGDMVRSVYDPNNIGKDVFNADNLNEGSRNLFLKTTERRAIAAILASQNSLVGQIAFFPATSAPSGWLKANGALVSRISYPDLWAFAAENGALVSETDWQAGAKGCFSYGTGEVSMFRIPDLRGEFLRGLDDGRGVDANRVIGSSQGDAIRNITGRLASFGTFPSSGLFGAFVGGTSSGARPSGSVAESVFWSTNFDASLVVPTALENRPRNIALLACIRY